MTTQTVRRWSAQRKAELVLSLLKGETTLEAAARAHGLEPEQLRDWRDRFLAGAERGLDDGQPRRELRVCRDVAEAVGNTPLVRLNRVVPGFRGEAWAKLEFMNPMGSVKDRVARQMVELAAGDGRLSPGDVIVEASSGNTAMGLGMMSILGGYRCKVVVRDRTSREKVAALRALGVEVQVVDGSLPREHPDSYSRIMEQVVRDTPDCYFPDQHHNRENNLAHYRTTGPELWEQMEGRIDAFVAGAGTGGTVSGVARFLKEQDPRIQVIAVDPVGSVFAGWWRERKLGQPRPWKLEGLGDEELCGCVEWDLIDDFLQVPEKEAFLCARELARKEAILAGGSSGAALWGVRQVAARLGEGARIATLFPDGGVRYLSTFFDDEWMLKNGYLP